MQSYIYRVCILYSLIYDKATNPICQYTVIHISSIGQSGKLYPINNEL